MIWDSSIRYGRQTPGPTERHNCLAHLRCVVRARLLVCACALLVYCTCSWVLVYPKSAKQCLTYTDILPWQGPFHLPRQLVVCHMFCCFMRLCRLNVFWLHLSAILDLCGCLSLWGHISCGIWESSLRYAMQTPGHSEWHIASAFWHIACSHIFRHSSRIVHWPVCIGISRNIFAGIAKAW